MHGLSSQWHRHFGSPERDRELNVLWRLAIGVGRVLYAIRKDWKRRDLSMQAMGLAFMTLLSLVPLLAVSFSFLKAFGVHHSLEPLMLQLVEPLGEKGHEIVERLLRFVDQLDVSVIGGLGLIFLLYAVFDLLNKIESSFNETWHIGASRTLSQKVTHYIGTLVLTPVFVFGALAIWAMVSHSPYVEMVVKYGWFNWLIWAVVKLAPTLFIAFAFASFYMIMPNTSVKFSSALVGGITAGVLWQTSGLLFGALVVKSGQYTAIYSALATPILFMIWVYLSWLVLLLGARIAYYHQNPYQLLAHLQQLPLSIVQRLTMTLWFLRTVWLNFKRGAGPVAISQLSTAQRLPPKVIEDVAQVLEEMKIVAHQPDGWHCQKDFASIPWHQFVDQWLLFPEQSTTLSGSQYEQLALKTLKAAPDERSLAQVLETLEDGFVGDE